MSGEKCQTCGPNSVEQHPRQPAVTRCANCKEWLTAPAPEPSEVAETTAGERERITADALELVREWTATDGRGDPALMLHGRDLEDFRDQLADVIAGRAS